MGCPQPELTLRGLGGVLHPDADDPAGDNDAASGIENLVEDVEDRRTGPGPPRQPDRVVAHLFELSGSRARGATIRQAARLTPPDAEPAELHDAEGAQIGS